MLTSSDPRDVSLGRYRLLALLGQGGMADVYLACTQGRGGFQKLLVVKIARFSGDAMLSTMFLDEARLAGRLSHPNIVQTYEIGEDGTRDYIVMEYLDGANFSRLRLRAKNAGGIPLRTSLTILTEVLEGLEYAHTARGIDGQPLAVVHRDLTPSNVMVTAQGEVKILDFGIAKAADNHSFTQTGRYTGKLDYMPPEQLRGERVDARADIFSVGVILAESAMNHRFWGSAAAPQMASRLGLGDLPPLDEAGFSPRLREICASALAPDREKRYPSAAAFKADLVDYLRTIGGPVPRQDLASYCCELALDDRAKLRVLIDSQLALHRDTTDPSTGSLPRMPTVVEPTMYDVEDIEVVYQQKPAASPDSSPAPTAMPVGRRSATPWIAGGVIALAIGGFAAVNRFVRAPEPGDVATPAPTVATQPPPSTTPQPSTQPAPTQPAQPPSVPATTTVRLEVIASPAEARVIFDGKLLGNPYVGTFARDTKIHDLRLEAPGYKPIERRFTLEQDAMLQLSLAPLREQPAPVAITRRATPPPSRAVSVTPAPPTPPATSDVAPTSPQPATAPPSEGRRALDKDALDKTPRRKLDSDVFDKTQPQPKAERENPWSK